MRTTALSACLLFAAACGGHHQTTDAGVQDLAVSGADLSVVDAAKPADLSPPHYPTTPSQSIAAPMGATDNFGIVLAVSADGSTIVTCGSSGGVASLLVYARSGSGYGTMPAQTILTPMNIESFCAQVGLSADGSTLAVGGVDGTSLKALVAIFARSGTMYPATPTQLVTTTDTGLPWSAALSADGNTLATSSNVGDGVFVYTRTGAMFPATPTQTLALPTGADAFFGTVVTMSGDGSRLVVGNASTTSTARVYIYSRSGGMYGTPTELAAPSGSGASFANTLSLRADGQELAEGGNPPLHMEIYSPSGGTYAEVESVTPPAGAPTNFGPTMALAADGTLIVGSPVTGVFLVYPPG